MIKNVKEYQEFNETRFVRTNLFQKGNSTAFMLNLLPGQTVPPHPHPEADVFLYIVEGTGTFIIDEIKMSVSEKDIIHCKDQEMLEIRNNGDHPLSIYVVLAKR